MDPNFVYPAILKNQTAPSYDVPDGSIGLFASGNRLYIKNSIQEIFELIDAEFVLQLLETGSYVTGDVVRPSETGDFINTSQTGQFVGDGETGAFLTTGAADGRYYGLSNGESISGYSISGFNDSITGISVIGDTTKTITLYQRDGTTLTANFTDNAGSGSSDTGYLTGYVLKSETGAFYPSSNPSGYITGVDLSSYATTVYVTGVSGHLQNQISNLNNATGSYVTGNVVRPSDTGNIAIGTITLSLNGGGSAITTGYKSFTSVNYSGEILSYTLLADKTGSIVIDIWKDSYANYPPTSGDSICASSKPTLSSQISNTDSVLTSWSKSFSAGDVFGFNVDSSSVVTNVNLTLKVKKA